MIDSPALILIGPKGKKVMSGTRGLRSAFGTVGIKIDDTEIRRVVAVSQQFDK